jgi:hypothetical protein
MSHKTTIMSDFRDRAGFDSTHFGNHFQDNAQHNRYILMVAFFPFFSHVAHNHLPPIRCDVTYVTNQQLGFDYLRDQMANLPSDLRLRQHTPFHCAIVDEADSVLIDEGRTPLVVSAQQEWAGSS